MQSEEILLAQEQSVECKKGLEKEVQGTLLLTNKRLVFVAANYKGSDEQDFQLSIFRLAPVHLRFVDVEDLSSIPNDKLDIAIPLERIDFEKGSRGILAHTKLEVRWLDESNNEKSAQFYADLSSRGRKKGLNDWARVIEDLKRGKIAIKIPQNLPASGALEGRIYYVMSDLQEKGLFEIEREAESKFKVDLDPDEVERACENLVSHGLLEKMKDSFYRLPSPLGEDDLSS